MAGNVDTASIGETLDMQPWELREHEFLHKSRKVVDNQEEHVPEEVTPEKKGKIKLKKLLEIFHDIESSKDKMLETDPNLE